MPEIERITRKTANRRSWFLLRYDTRPICTVWMCICSDAWIPAKKYIESDNKKNTNKYDSVNIFNDVQSFLIFHDIFLLVLFCWRVTRLSKGLTLRCNESSRILFLSLGATRICRLYYNKKGPTKGSLTLCYYFCSSLFLNEFLFYCTLDCRKIQRKNSTQLFQQQNIVWCVNTSNGRENWA